MRTSVTTLSALACLVLLPTRAESQGQLRRLSQADAEPQELFGYSVDISGDRAIVGAHQDSHVGMASGTAFLYEVSSGQKLRNLPASNRHALMMFGFSVAIEGDRAVVGAPAYNLSGYEFFGGAAYLYDVPAGQEITLIIPADNFAGDWFGTSVSISTDHIVIGAPGDTVNGTWSGSAYVLDASTGQELFKLVPDDGYAGDNFGCDVAVDGDHVVVGALYDDPNGWTFGSAYVFSVSDGSQLHKIVPADGSVEDYFGWSVALDDGKALIGAPRDDDFNTNSGSAYIFDVSNGQQLFKLLPSAAIYYQFFGQSVDIRDGLAVVGAPNGKCGSTDTGCAYSFDVSSGVKFARMCAEDGASGDQFGNSVGVSRIRAILGAPAAVDGRGAAYVFLPVPSAVPYCFGDPGSGWPCPCANDNDGSVPGSGCANGISTAGAQLTETGTASVGQDDLMLVSTALDPNNSSLYFQANNRVNGGDGTYFGEGLRCAGGGLIRLEVQSSNSLGISATTISIAAKGAVTAGDTKRYQCWYRDTSGGQYCGPGTYDFNLTNGLEIHWLP